MLRVQSAFLVHFTKRKICFVPELSLSLFPFSYSAQKQYEKLTLDPGTVYSLTLVSSETYVQTVGRILCTFDTSELALSYLVFTVLCIGFGNQQESLLH